VGDRFGRKVAIMAYSVIFILGGVLQTIGIDLPMMYAGRFFAGFGIGKFLQTLFGTCAGHTHHLPFMLHLPFIGANSCLVPIYIAEISPQNVRGKLGTLWQGNDISRFKLEFFILCISLLIPIIGCSFHRLWYCHLLLDQLCLQTDH
jgi:MFS family permease